MQGHKRRLIVAFIAVPLIVLFILRLPKEFFLALLLAVNAVALLEFLRIYKVSKHWCFLGVVLGSALFLLNCLDSSNSLYYYSISFIVVSLVRLLSKRNPEGALSDIAPLYVSFLYIPTLLPFVWFIRDYGAYWVIYLLAVVWASDSFAYYLGKGFGRRKLYPEVSPKKTWEGALGSLIGGTLVSVILGGLLELNNLLFLLIVGFAIGVISVFGDLVESMFKRDGGVKDSGFLFPEHGGILDKIDSMLFAGVLLYFALQLF